MTSTRFKSERNGHAFAKAMAAGENCTPTTQNKYVWPHTSFNGGLVDGPPYTSTFNRLIGLRIVNGDEYVEFQSGLCVYHDDYGDYSTNEPAMDGTASLAFYLSAMEE